MDRLRDLASEKAVVIFTKSSCCICHSVESLFQKLGASPAIHKLNRNTNRKELERALRELGCNLVVLTVFIRDKLVSSTKDIISLHVDGSLKRMLKEAKAIWL